METIRAQEDNNIDAWQRTRELAYIIYLANTMEKDRVSKTQFMPLPGDIETKAALATQIDQWVALGLLTRKKDG